MSDERQRPARPWVKVAVGLVVGLLVGVALWLTVPRGPVFNAVGLEPPGCAEAVSTYERENERAHQKLREYEDRGRLLDDTSRGDGVGVVPASNTDDGIVDNPEAAEEEVRQRAKEFVDPYRQRQRQAEWVEEPFREAFNSIETMALVVEQNPDCFSAEERATIEQRYRAGQRAMEQRGY